MTFLLQNPALLGLLALAGVPLLVHLISRARPPVYRFSNIDFLRRVLRSSARVRQPKDRLLLILRTLALLALAAAFLSPVLISKSVSLPGEDVTVIMLIDRSASMAAREGAGSRFDIARGQATEYLESRRPTAANLVWIDAEPDTVFPEPSPNIPFLVERLNEARPAPEAGPPGPAFDAALRQLANARGRRELVILSDFQQSAWRDFEPALPPDVTVHAHQVASSSPANVAITGLLAQPTGPVVGQEITLLARVRNFSPDPVRAQVTMDADGARRTEAAEIPAWGESELAFPLRPAGAGPLPVSVSTEADSFPADDSRFAVIHVRESLRMTLDSPGDSADFRLLMKLASALPWLDAGSADASVRPPDFRFIGAWDGSDAADLRAMATAGTTLIVRPATSCPPAALAELLDVPPDLMPASFSKESSTEGWSVLPEENHPAIQLFRAGDFGNPFAGTFRERIPLPSPLAAAGRPIASFADRKPAVTGFPTPGAPILLWTLPLDPAVTDWPLQGVFLPAVAEILLHARPRGTTAGNETSSGGGLAWSSADPELAGTVRLVDPDDNPLDLIESNTADGTTWSWPGPARPGIHRWQSSGQTLAATAVNFPEIESDLRPLEDAPAIGRLESGAGTLLRKAALANGIPLWPWLALLALAFLLTESIIHLRPNN